MPDESTQLPSFISLSYASDSRFGGVLCDGSRLDHLSDRDNRLSDNRRNCV